MADVDAIMGPEMLQLNIPLTCLCEGGLEQMQIVNAAAGSGSFANAVSAARFECPKCHHQIAAEILVGTRYDRPVT